MKNLEEAGKQERHALEKLENPHNKNWLTMSKFEFMRMIIKDPQFFPALRVGLFVMALFLVIVYLIYLYT